MDILEQIGITKDELINRIVDRALGITAGYEQTGEESWQEIPFSSVVDEKIEKSIGNLIDSMKSKIQTQIDIIMLKKIEEVFKAPFQPVDRWGDKKGEVTTIKDMIANEAQDFWAQKVDEDGRRYDGYGSKLTMAQYHAKKVIKEFYDSQLKIEVDKMVKDFRSKIPETIGQEMAKSVTKYFK